MARLLGLKASIQGADKKRHVVVVMTRTVKNPPDDDTLKHVSKNSRLLVTVSMKTGQTFSCT